MLVIPSIIFSVLVNVCVFFIYLFIYFLAFQLIIFHVDANPSIDFDFCSIKTTVILNNLAKAHAESGSYEHAEELAREAIRIAEKTQSTHLSRFTANLGTILNLEGMI